MNVRRLVAGIGVALIVPLLAQAHEGASDDHGFPGTARATLPEPMQRLVDLWEAIFGPPAPEWPNGRTDFWPDGPGHDHWAPAHHAGVGFGFEELAHVDIAALLSDASPMAKRIGEIDVKRDPATGQVWVALALLDRAGFVLLDGTDPSHPIVVAVVEEEAPYPGYAADVKLSDDTDTLYLAVEDASSLICEAAWTHANLSIVPERVDCGIEVWDVSDKASPRFRMTWITGGRGSHMMDVETFGGEIFVSGAARGTIPGIYGLPIAQLDAAGTPRLVGRILAPFSHDVTLRADPLDATRALAFVAAGGDGVAIFDLADPSFPIPIGSWKPPAEEGDGYVHTVMPIEIDGRRIVIVEEESQWSGSSPGPLSELFFVDFTNLGEPELLGTWHNPDEKHAIGGFLWSTHNFNVDSGVLYLAHFHGGVLALDVSDLDRLADPPILANYVPAKTAGAYTWDAVPHDGIVWASDIGNGLFALRLA